jgi:hypothetical protein
MLLAFFAQLISHLLGWLEQHYLRWTQLPDSSLSLAFAMDLMRSKSDLLLENALLRQQLLILHAKSKNHTSPVPSVSPFCYWPAACRIGNTCC